VNRKFILPGIVLIAAAAAWWLWRGRDVRAEPTDHPIEVRRGDIHQSILATGIVQPQNRVEIKPPIAGRIEDVLVREGATVKKGAILAWMSSTDRAALLDAARARGEEELARWQELYKAAPLVAPLDGTVIARRVEPGQTVTAADTVLVLSDRLIVKAQVDETDIGRVKLKQRADVALDAYPDTVTGGRVDHIAYEAETVNNVTIYHVDVLPEKVPDFMRSGMTANVTFYVQSRNGVLVLPSEAVRHADGKATVRVPGDGAPRRIEVQTGLDDGKYVEITGGLAEGDRVLVAGYQLPKATAAAGNPFMPAGPGRRPR
jgi:macrolide-specific efflux system membrane fusion protein